MKNLEFKSIYDKLNDPCDIDFLVGETGLDKELLKCHLYSKDDKGGYKKVPCRQKERRKALQGVEAR